MGTDKSRITIAIVGGGIGGLCAAIGLARAGYDIHIFEKAAKFSEIGAGVALGPNAVEAVRLLGFLPDYEAVADVADPGEKWFSFVTWDTGDFIGETFCKSRHSLVHRARLLETLLPLLPPNVTTHFSARVTHVANLADSTSVRLTFAPPHGPATFDAHAAIGADGVKSAVRTEGRMRYTGTYAYRGLLPMHAALARNGEAVREPRMWFGPDKHLLTFPIEGGTVLNLVAFVSDRTQDPDARVWDGAWVRPCAQAEMLADFDGWHPGCRSLLELIEKPERWALHELVPLERWTDGRITLLGDSAHASLPHNGAGAGQATEDAYVLSALLAHPACTTQTLPRFLAAYEHARLERASRQQVYARESGDIYEFAGPFSVDDVGSGALGQHLAHRYEWIWEHDLERDVRDALKWLEEEGVLGDNSKQ